MVGRVGYAPTTPAMSMQYSTIELTALNLNYNLLSLEFVNIFVFLFIANIIEKLIQKIVKLKSVKKDPLGIIGKKIVTR